MFCKSCGKQIDNDSNFCSFCGVKQSTVNKFNSNPSNGVIIDSKSNEFNLFQKFLDQIKPGLLKGSKLILFLFLSFIATGLLISLSHFGKIPALWAIPFVIVIFYQIIYRVNKTKIEKSEIESINQSDKKTIILPVKTPEEIEKERLEGIEYGKFNAQLNRWALISFLGLILLVLILLLSTHKKTAANMGLPQFGLDQVTSASSRYQSSAMGLTVY